MRIFKNKLYLIATIPGISGFQRWDKRELRIMLGHRAKTNSRLDIVGEFNPDRDTFCFILEDGHLLDCCPKTGLLDEALSWLIENPHNSIYLGEFDKNDSKCSAISI